MTCPMRSVPESRGRPQQQRTHLLGRRDLRPPPLPRCTRSWKRPPCYVHLIAVALQHTTGIEVGADGINHEEQLVVGVFLLQVGRQLFADESYLPAVLLIIHEKLFVKARHNF